MLGPCCGAKFLAVSSCSLLGVLAPFLKQWNITASPDARFPSQVGFEDSWQGYASGSNSRQDYASGALFPPNLYTFETETSEGRRGNDMPYFGKVILKVTAYFVSTQWRNPAWRLITGRYLVRAVVVCGGQRFRFQARLINDVSRTDFRLEDGVMC